MGERRNRYGIENPTGGNRKSQLDEVSGENADGKEDPRIRYLLGYRDECPDEILKGDKEMLVSWLTEQGEGIQPDILRGNGLTGLEDEMPSQEIPVEEWNER